MTSRQIPLTLIREDARERLTAAVEHAPLKVPSEWHRFDTNGSTYLYVANGSQVYEVDVEAFSRSVKVPDTDRSSGLMAALGISSLPVEAPLEESPPLRTLSLAVAQKCNLGCTYCYAQEGSFGSEGKLMPLNVAIAAVERLFSDCAAGSHVHLAFLGGEPLVNRAVLRAATDYAAKLAQQKNIDVGFSITTNGTLVTLEDGSFFEGHGFSVTVSLDGIGEVHDRVRAYRDGRGSYDVILERLRPLLLAQRRMQLSARVTVTPVNLNLRETLDQFIRLGFHSVGFSPMLASPTGRAEMAERDLEMMLSQMIDCGSEFERQMARGGRYPFANMVNAMREIHRGSCRPHPCGAGEGYFGVSADGDLSACHRFVNDPVGAMGSIAEGVDPTLQRAWLASRHVDRQDPCRSCWARYLCGGGCHHEVIHRGRPACDYIRGWLDYALGAYVRLLDCRPDYFVAAPAMQFAGKPIG